MRSALRFLLPGLFALVGIGCGQHDLGVCDITLRSCQEDVYSRVLALRGDGYDPFGPLPPVTVITEAQYRQMLLDQQAAAVARGQAPLTRAVDKAMLLLHFTSAGAETPTTDGGTSDDAGSGGSVINDEATFVYAYYSPTSKTITIVSHPNQTDERAAENAMLTLAHELVHALQDRELDLGKDDFRTTDEVQAWDAMIEGDARFYEDMFVNDVRKLIGMGPLDLVDLVRSEVGTYYDQIDKLGSPMFASRALLYPLGAYYLARVFESGGNAAVRHAYAKGPKHTVGLLADPDHGPPSSDATGEPTCSAPFTTSLPTIGDTTGADIFGGLLFYTFLRGWNLSHELAFATARAWTADYLRVQTDAEVTTTAAAWRIELASPPSATVVQALSATGELAVASDSRSLTITVSDSPTELPWMTACR